MHSLKIHAQSCPSNALYQDFLPQTCLDANLVFLMASAGLLVWAGRLAGWLAGGPNTETQNMSISGISHKQTPGICLFLVICTNTENISTFVVFCSQIASQGVFGRDLPINAQKTPCFDARARSARSQASTKHMTTGWWAGWEASWLASHTNKHQK